MDLFLSEKNDSHAPKESPEFEYIGEDRIPATTLGSWKEFFELLESEFFSSRYEQFVFRGQRRHDWGLMPTLGRLTENGIVTAELAKDQLDRFKLAVRGRINDPSLVHDDEELWAVGQHHGLMTPLLDWTASSYVALFFAFSKSDVVGEKDNPYRVVYALDKELIAEHGGQLGIELIEPKKDTYGRLVNQAGLFTYSPTDGTLENILINFISGADSPDGELLANASAGEDANIIAKRICKILIKNDDRDACLKHLKRMNVHHASLFPDLIGAAEYCNAAAEYESHKRISDDFFASVSAEEIVESVNKFGITAEPLLNSNESTGILERNLRKDIAQRDALLNELKSIIDKTVTAGWLNHEQMQAKTRVSLNTTLNRRYGLPRKASQMLTAQIFDDVLAKVREP